MEVDTVAVKTKLIKTLRQLAGEFPPVLKLYPKSIVLSPRPRILEIWANGECVKRFKFAEKEVKFCDIGDMFQRFPHEKAEDMEALSE